MICLVTLLQPCIDCWCSCFTFSKYIFFTFYFFIKHKPVLCWLAQELAASVFSWLPKAPDALRSSLAGQRLPIKGLIQSLFKWAGRFTPVVVRCAVTRKNIAMPLSPSKNTSRVFLSCVDFSHPVHIETRGKPPRGTEQDVSALTASCLGALRCDYQEGYLTLFQQEWIDIVDSSCLK